MNPKGLKFTEDHEWLQIDGDIATIGISDYAQKELGDVVYVELPEMGSTHEKGDTCSNIESVKAVSDIYSPVSGEITAVNDSLEDAPEKVNQDPYGEGWIMKMKLSNSDELQELMDSEAYEEYVKGLTED